MWWGSACSVTLLAVQLPSSYWSIPGSHFNLVFLVQVFSKATTQLAFCPKAYYGWANRQAWCVPRGQSRIPPKTCPQRWMRQRANSVTCVMRVLRVVAQFIWTQVLAGCASGPEVRQSLPTDVGGSSCKQQVL